MSLDEVLRSLETAFTIGAICGALGCLWFVVDCVNDLRAHYALCKLEKIPVDTKIIETGRILIAMVLAHATTLLGFAALGILSLSSSLPPPQREVMTLRTLVIYVVLISIPSFTVVVCQIYRQRLRKYRPFFP